MTTELENELEEAVPAASETDEADATPAEQSADAEPSTAEDVSKPEETTLSVVRDVVGKREDDAAASSASEEETGQAAGEEATQEEPDAEDYSDVPFNKHPRFQALLTERAALKLDADRYKNVETFISENNLNGDEAADILRIGGLMKTDPAKAWAEMKPMVQKVLIAAGEVLPEDLTKRVQDGEMSREAAMEVSRLRAAQQSTQARTQWESQRNEQRQQTDAVTAIQSTVSSWEAERQARDPNFSAKLPALQKEIAWLQVSEGKPKTADAVKAQLQKAYDAVSASYTPPAVIPAQRQKPAVRPVVGGQVNGNTRPKIENTHDAINAVIARRAG
ncbi:hypothetical protein OEG84_11480 [Hoeflea sp. G2-23]|uniref:Scaffolding protein n=1 Tax=Hoeflea algicola TaxID=2983763 RepID=A0ABT3Z952_9HYPH|nr:hypothetical protein [Hoeflea algicola]MCY0148314.1 hypothetical protein [Hoeflea algicola]